MGKLPCTKRKDNSIKGFHNPICLFLYKKQNQYHFRNLYEMGMFRSEVDSKNSMKLHKYTDYLPSYYQYPKKIEMIFITILCELKYNSQCISLRIL